MWEGRSVELNLPTYCWFSSGSVSSSQYDQPEEDHKRTTRHESSARTTIDVILVHRIWYTLEHSCHVRVSDWHWDSGDQRQNHRATENHRTGTRVLICYYQSCHYMFIGHASTHMLFLVSRNLGDLWIHARPSVRMYGFSEQSAHWNFLILYWLVDQ